MTRGNQRELARAKNQKKQQEHTKSKKNNDGLTLEQRKFRDAELMREKQRRKEEQKGQAQAYKEYDMKINSNDEAETTVQTLLKQQFPSLANDRLFHEFYFPHRLDYATSGLMCIPTNKESCRAVSSAFHNRKSKKYYIAIVRGLFSKEIVALDMAIGEDVREQNIQKMCTAASKYCIKSRAARTIFVMLDKGLYDNYPATKVLIRPVTGRRHQIRAHCSYLGHTIVGDYTYSNRKDVNPSRMFLHSLRLVLPNSLETIDVNTGDPFVEVKGWKIVKKINSIDKITYDKFESFL